MLADAKQVEEVAVEKGLDFCAADITISGNAVRRAYQIVALIRARAKTLSTGDQFGAHYFGSLLGWNLRILKIPHIRRIKKSLALYSSALLLKRFDDAARR